MALDTDVTGAAIAVAPSTTLTLSTLIHDIAARHADRPAVEAADARLTYAELLDAAGDLASKLADAGIGAGDRVGVRVPSGTADLYVAILGVLESGAAYVPVDADDTDHRAETVWREAGVCAVVGEAVGLTVRAPGAGRGAPAGPEDDAWIIFTSGSTGAPKGVAVSHRSAVAFVQAEQRLWTVAPEDRVLAGLSVAFDASCEELWLAWANGAALVPAPRCVVRSGADLGPWLAERGVTVVSTVPTLAAMWDDDVLAGVRLLICGGEALPDELARRLAGERELWNTYGPTEATVVSTAARVVPGEPVTIGWPLAGWEVAVVDEAGRPVAFGEPGELVIGGVGLARYLDAELDAQRFAPDFALGWARAYRTGDVVRETSTGLAFVGRRDDQVKLGGRRLELGEVDAHLASAPGVRAAATTVRRSEAGNPILVGYVCGDVDAAAVRAHIAPRMPEGITPLLVVLDELPVRTSGKVDRAALPWPPPAAGDSTVEGFDATAAWVAECWVRQLGPLPLEGRSDFFDLGGSSLAAAKLVSELRTRFPGVAVADVYEHRTLAALAEHLDGLGSWDEDDDHTMAEHRRGPLRWAAAQLAGVFVLLTVTVPAWLLGVFAYDNWQHTGPQVPWAWIAAGLVVLSAPARAGLAIAARRVFLTDLEPGRYRRRSWLATRVWFVDRLAEVLHLGGMGGTPWAGRVARMLGADVAPTARLATMPTPSSLIHVGDGATIEADVDVHGWWIEGDELVVGELRIGPGARVGTRSVLMPGANIGAGAEIEPGSVVSTAVPAGERWAGSPARRVGEAGGSWPQEAPARERRPWFWKAMFAVSGVFLSTISLIAAIPGLVLLAAVWGISSSVTGLVTSLIVAAPLLALVFVVCEAIVNALAFRAASRFIRPGWHGDEGGTAWALWFTGQIHEASLTALFPLYATVFTRTWLRLHGIRVGRRTEVSTTGGLNRLVALGETSMVADHPMFAAVRANRGWLHLTEIAVGDGTFVGNGAVLPAGASVGDGCLIGIETNAPQHAPDGTSWFGAPALELPRVPDAADPARTTHPPRRLVAARAATEIVRILLPTSVSIVLGALVLLAVEAVGAAGGGLAMAAAAPFVVAAGAVAAVLVTIAVKWIVIGRYRPGRHPLWSSLVWRDEIVNSCQEQLAGEWLLEKAQGSPVVPAYLRAMGARVGRDVWCDTLAVTEFDMVTLGDGCAVNRGACLETHLFHDRLLRIGPTAMGTGATLGPVSAILPDTRLGDGCVVGARSVVLRGEELPDRSRWHGAPVVAVRR